MKHLLLYMMIFTFFLGCLVEKQTRPLPTITSFQVEPLSVTEGQSVTLSIVGSRIDSCVVYAGSTALTGFSLTDGLTHIPEFNTIYRVVCQGPGGSIESEEVLVVVKLKPVISEFKVEPLSVNEGSPVTLSVVGKNIESCVVVVNGEEIALDLNDGIKHTPSQLKTEYSAECQGPGGVIKTGPTLVNVVLADDIIKADSLAEIGKIFDIEAVKKVALNKVSGKITDFDPEYKTGTVELSKNYAMSISKVVASISRKHSLLYGYEGYHDFEAYSEQCQEAFDESNNELYSFAAFSDEILEPSAISREFVIPGEYHITGFEAVTKSLEDPIPTGTEWKLDFALSQTKISYLESFTDFGIAEGVFTIDNEGIIPVKVGDDYVPESVTFSSSTFSAPVIPNGYPIPPKTDKYPRDPNHPSCNTDRPEIEIEIIYDSPRDFCERSGHIGCEPGYENRLPKSWPHRIVTKKTGKPITEYFSKFPSNRILKGDALLQCNEIFPLEAEMFDLGPKWQIQTWGNQVLFFVTSDDCLDFNTSCQYVKPRLSQVDPDNWNIEPASNFCIDRWKKYPWDDYQKILEGFCQSADAYQEAVESTDQQGANALMANECKGDSLCKNLVESIKLILENSYLLSAIETTSKESQEELRRAKKNGRSFVFPKVDPKSVSLEDKNYLVSRLADFENNLGINSLIMLMRAGYKSIEEIHKATGGDWNVVLSDPEFLAVALPEGFQSPEELLSTIQKYEKVLGLGEFKGQGLNATVAPEIKKLSCDYEVTGRIRDFSQIIKVQVTDQRLKETTFSSSAQNIAPVTIE